MTVEADERPSGQPVPLSAEDRAILDLDLGGEDGFAFLEELRSAHPSLPIVIVAAADHRDDVMRAIDQGALNAKVQEAVNVYDDYVKKKENDDGKGEDKAE